MKRELKFKVAKKQERCGDCGALIGKGESYAELYSDENFKNICKECFSKK